MSSLETRASGRRPNAPSDPVLSALEHFRHERSDDAFRLLYQECTPRLWALALRLSGGRRVRAEELVQECWIRAIERIDRFEGRSALSTWLSGILVNCYREQSRRLAREPEQIENGAGLDRVAAENSLTSAADGVDLERALQSLAAGYRAVVVLFEVNGYSHREIAGLLGIDEGTSKSQLARGRARLRELLSAGPASSSRSARREGRPS